MINFFNLNSFKKILTNSLPNDPVPPVMKTVLFGKIFEFYFFAFLINIHLVKNSTLIFDDIFQRFN